MTCISRPSITNKDRERPFCTRLSGVEPMNLPILPTTVVGSYSMPGWLERLKTEYFARRISRHELDEIHDSAVKAAIKDQEVAGVDIITDGELRRDNIRGYFAQGCA